MRATSIAKILAAQGINVRSFTAGDYSVDGEVDITDLVHVQVPTTGRACCVVVFDPQDESFMFYPLTTDFTKLADDVRTALGMVPA